MTSKYGGEILYLKNVRVTHFIKPEMGVFLNSFSSKQPNFDFIKAGKSLSSENDHEALREK